MRTQVWRQTPKMLYNLLFLLLPLCLRPAEKRSTETGHPCVMWGKKMDFLDATSVSNPYNVTPGKMTRSFYT